MANKTIVQLPEQTGVTDNDVLAIVDSGETTTSKIKVSTLLSGAGGGKFIQGDGTNSIVNDWIPTSAATAPNSFIINSSGSTLGQYAYNGGIIGGENNQLSGLSVGRGQNNSVIVGGENNICSNDEWQGIFVGINNNIAEGDNAVICGGSNGAVLREAGSILGGFSHYVFTHYSTCVGGYNNTMSKFGGNYHGIIGGLNNTINGTGNSKVIVGGESNTLSHGRSIILGGSSQTSLQDDEVVVPKLRTTEYASLNFSGDTAAAAAGVQLGEFYHDNGAVRVRIT